MFSITFSLSSTIITDIFSEFPVYVLFILRLFKFVFIIPPNFVKTQHCLNSFDKEDYSLLDEDIQLKEFA